MPEIWKLNGNIFFKLFFSDLDEKNNLCRLRTTSKGKQQNKIILPENIFTLSRFTRKPKILWIISALVASNWSQINFFILAKILMSISEFSPNKHSSMTQTQGLKSWKRRTAENYSRSIVMLLTWNRLHFSWSYWLPKILLLPYTCDGIIGCCSNSIHKRTEYERRYTEQQTIIYKIYQTKLTASCRSNLRRHEYIPAVRYHSGI